MQNFNKEWNFLSVGEKYLEHDDDYDDYDDDDELFLWCGWTTESV